MTITAMDERSALLVIDLQVGTLAAELAHPPEGIIANAVTLIGAYREHGLPVVLASVTSTPAGRTAYGEGARDFPAEWSALIPELDAQPTDILLPRASWSAFAGTDLDARLRALRITQVVLVGVATSFGIESTARDAYDRGYNVTIAVDGVTDRSADAHDGSVTRVFPALGQLGTTAEIIAALTLR
jgi:nicotinamidase-related amidase